MSSFINLKSRLFNQPLLLEPSYAQVLFGALSDKLNIESLIDGELKLNNEALKEGAYSFGDDRSERKPYQVKSGAAIIPVSGSLVAKSGYMSSLSGITGYDSIKASLDVALADDDVNELIFDMDSAGGEVTGCFELADYIYSKRGTKKMTALVGGLACSACYALAAATGNISISETATVGSIGVITAHTDVSEAMDKQGVKVTLIHAGNHKADGNPYEGLSDEVKGRIQTRLDSMYTMFTTRVAKYRGISVESVIKTQALTYLGSDAIDVGLADKVVSTIDFIEELSHTSGLNINLENNMPKEHDEALAAATATGVKTGEKAGAIAMQARIKGIMASEEASGRNALAEHMAYETDMTIEASVAMLSKSPKEQPVVAEVVAEPVVAAKVDSGLDTAMQEAAAPVVAETEEAAVTAESDPVAFAKASYKLING